MIFTLKQLRYIETAGRHKSIAKAAKELSISQSSITAAIDQLESRLDCDLFIRTPAKGIQPTPAGLEALGVIRKFIHQSRQFESELKSIGGDASGLVRIACYVTAAPAFLPPILQDVTEKFPGMSVQVLEGSMEDIMRLLDEGQADLAFTYEDLVRTNHEFHALFAAPPYALISRNDPLASAASVQFSQLAERPMVLLDLPHSRNYFEMLFETHGLRPHIAHTTRSAEIARTLVAGGFGFTILNIRPPLASEENTLYRAVPLTPTPRAPQFGIATIAGIRPPKIVQAFIERCQNLRAAGAFDDLVVQAHG